jgi:ribosomal protein S18 acetylase RimI-like enzyme
MQPEPAVIREARVSDAEAIARVHVESSQDAYAPLARDWPTSDLPARVARWASSLEANAMDARQVDLVATVAGVVVAFIGGGAARRNDVEAELEIYVIHVLPRHRARGIGSRLWDTACGRLRGKEEAAMYVETLAELRCCSFYEAHGGEVASRVPRDFHGGVATGVVYFWPKGRSHASIAR